MSWLCWYLDTIWGWLQSSVSVPLSGSYWGPRSLLYNNFANIRLLFWIYLKFAFFQWMLLMAEKFWIFLLFWDQKEKLPAAASSLSHLGLLSRGWRMSVSKLTYLSSTDVWWIFVTECWILIGLKRTFTIMKLFYKLILKKMLWITVTLWEPTFL